MDEESRIYDYVTSEGAPLTMYFHVKREKKHEKDGLNCRLKFSHSQNSIKTREGALYNANVLVEDLQDGGKSLDLPADFKSQDIDWTWIKKVCADEVASKAASKAADPKPHKSKKPHVSTKGRPLLKQKNPHKAEDDNFMLGRERNIRETKKFIEKLKLKNDAKRET